MSDTLENVAGDVITIADYPLPSKSKTGKQARAALKRLRDLGLYSGDLRKKPTKYALAKIDKFDAVLKGKATVVKPRNAKRFKNIFETVGKSVIVPKRKGERISVDKSGEIVSIRKSGKRVIRARGQTLKRDDVLARPAANRNVQYAVPFNGHNGETNWFRFPDFDELKKFMAGYDYKDWRDYVVVEDVDNELDDDELNERAERKRKGLPIKGNKGIAKIGPKRRKAKAKKTKRKTR